MTFAVVLSTRFAREVTRERAWLYDHRGRQRADAFEAELAHFLDLVASCPEMGNPVGDERHWYLRRSRFHVYYRTSREKGTVVLHRLRHAAQGPET